MGVKATGDGLRAYYKGKLEELEIKIRDKQHNLWRMEAQRNDLNMKGELPLLLLWACILLINICKHSSAFQYNFTASQPL